MLKRSLLSIFGCLTSLFCLDAPSLANTHDVGIIDVKPGTGWRTPINIPTPVVVDVSNFGTADEQNIGVRVVIKNSNGYVVYDDSVTLAALQSQMHTEVSLQDWTPTSHSPYYLTATVTIADDEDLSNNDRTGNTRVGYERDVKASSVTSPSRDAEKLQKVTFSLSGVFQSIGLNEIYECPARCQVRKCSDNKLVFQSDSVIPYLPSDSSEVALNFPSSNGSYDVRRLDPGCYTIAVIARYPSDGDRNNDTAYSTFDILPNKLSNDVAIDTNSGPSSSIQLTPGQPTPLSFSFKNVGKNAQSSVRTIVAITNASKQEVYRDTVTILNWGAGSTKTATFKAFTPTTTSTLSLKAYSVLPTDEFRGDDSLTRSFVAGAEFDVQAIAVTYPPPGQTIKPGLFKPTGTFRWVGAAGGQQDVYGRFVIRIKGYSDPSFVSDTSAAGKISIESPLTTLQFPASKNGSSTADLRKGDYEAELIAMDNAPANNKVKSTFRLAYENDVKPDSLSISIWDVANLGKPMEVFAAARNIGTRSQPLVTIDVRITDRFGKIVYHESTTASIPASEKRGIKLADFTPVTKGGYTITFTATIAQDEDESDNSLEYTMWLDDNQHDVSIVEAVQPRMQDKKAFGASFDPAIKVRYDGLWPTDSAPVHVNVRIHDCQKDFQFFVSSTDVEVSGTRTVSFQDRPAPTRISALPPGCYTATFTVRPVNLTDNILSDDTLIVPFEVRDALHVREESEILLSSFIASGSLHIAYPASGGSLYWTIFSINGSPMLSGRENDHGGHLEIPLAALPSGSYIFEVQNSEGTIGKTLFNYVR